MSCRKCEPCLAKRRRHWLGRMAAEAYTSQAVRFVTLTYDEENIAEGRNLPTDHVKFYCKSRRRKHPFRHFTVGEFGDKTGRPHWHMMQFYPSTSPGELLGFSQMHGNWSHGNSQYELPRSLAASCSYVYDYLDKGGLALRPSPGLGRTYLERFAVMAANNRRRLATQEGIPYTVPNARKPQGGLWVYHITPSHHYAALMAEAYIEAWQNRWHSDPDYRQFERIAYG